MSARTYKTAKNLSFNLVFFVEAVGNKNVYRLKTRTKKDGEFLDGSTESFRVVTATKVPTEFNNSFRVDEDTVGEFATLEEALELAKATARIAR